MPASRIAFAFADLGAEIARLHPDRDAKPSATILLDEASFRLVTRELREYGAPVGAGLEPVAFSGFTIECKPPG